MIVVAVPGEEENESELRLSHGLRQRKEAEGEAEMPRIASGSELLYAAANSQICTGGDISLYLFFLRRIYLQVGS